MLVSIQAEKITQPYSTNELSLTNHLPHQPQDLSRLGMAVRLELRIQQLSVHTYLELTPIRWDERDCLDQVLIVLEQFIHQAHGPASVVSDRAIDNLDLQHGSLREF